MPTAARLAAALGFVAVAFFASEIYKGQLPDGIAMGMLTIVNCAIGFWAGWGVMGRLAGRGYAKAVGSGLRAAFVLLFYALIAWSLYEMLRKSLRKLYEGPMEALQAMAKLMADYVMLGLQDPQIPIVLVVGGICAALFSEWASQQFK